MQRDFTVVSKGKKRRTHKPFITLETEEGEKLTLYLEGPEQLDQFEIDEVYTVKIVEGEQKKLD